MPSLRADTEYLPARPALGWLGGLFNRPRRRQKSPQLQREGSISYTLSERNGKETVRDGRQGVTATTTDASPPNLKFYLRLSVKLEPKVERIGHRRGFQVHERPIRFLWDNVGRVENLEADVTITSPEVSQPSKEVLTDPRSSRSLPSSLISLNVVGTPYFPGTNRPFRRPFFQILSKLPPGQALPLQLGGCSDVGSLEGADLWV